jgi:hypothetical protein
VARVYLAIAQPAFDSGSVLVVSYRLAAWALGTVGMPAARVASALAERNAFSRRLRDSRLELIQRLGQAVDSHDAETGEHTHRIGVLSRRLALEVGWSPREAQMLMYAAPASPTTSARSGSPTASCSRPGRSTARSGST